jgi:small-conductance mechanosensitive channel
MKCPVKEIFRILLSIAVFLISSHASAHEQTNGNPTSESKRDVSVLELDLSEIIPEAAKLSGKLSILENRVTNILDISEFEKKYANIEENLRKPLIQLQQIKESKDRRIDGLVKLRNKIEQEKEIFEKISKPFNETISQLGGWRKDWLAEKQNWNKWQSALSEEGDLTQLTSTFEEANNTIDKALEIINSQLNVMLPTQKKAGNILARIYALRAELETLILGARAGVRISISPPMFSPQYFNQFSNELWYEFQKSLDQIPRPESLFFEQQGFLLFLQVFLSFLVIIGVYRNRQVLSESKRWSFLAARPFSTGLFFSTMMFILFYEYLGSHVMRGFVLLVIGGISFSRLINAIYPKSWKSAFVYGLSTVFITTRLLQLIALPLPLFRLYTVLTASIGVFFLLRWASESSRRETSGVYGWSLRLGAIFLAVIIVTEISGKQGLAGFLFYSLIRSTATLLGFMLFLYMIHGVIEWVFNSSSLKQTALFSGNTEVIVNRAIFFIDAAICGIVLLPGTLTIWGVYENLPEAVKGLLAKGFNLGSYRISVGLVIVSVGILYISFLVSQVVQKLLVDQVLTRRRIEIGVKVSIARLVHYVLIFIGFVVALLALGFEFTKLTIMLSALGVGIGFGLQNIVNNFVSGLILLFERPVRVGDYIELDGRWAEIKDIGLRATIVQTFDQADVIIPNADMVANQVINWTLTNRLVRLTIPVGVAYGSDISLVMETLSESAKDNSKVAKTPAPQVLYLNFGESALEFELRVWVLDADNWLIVSSELHQEIDRRFREAKIEIAFPQRDLHLRSLDESVMLPSIKTAK